MLETISLVKTFPSRSTRDNKNQQRDPREKRRTFNAVDGVSFKAQQGEVFGLLGPNGAGKTTLLRILSTALKPTSGTVLCNGVDINRNPMEVRKRIGFLSGNTGLYGRLTAHEMLQYYGELHGLDRPHFERRLRSLTQLLDMGSFLNRRNDALSAGMRQKVSIARSLIHDPDILLFDELTTGLDVAAADAVLKTVENCKHEGKTVLFSSHHMDEVERLCDQVVVMNLGKICYEGNAQGMRSKTDESHLDRAFLKLIDHREEAHAE